jgi:nucleosome assembly protein 1-like 1
VEGALEPAAIPEFWLTALRNHVELSEIITDGDAELLKHLVDIRLTYLPADAPAPGYKLSFVFEKNDWFENEVLDKTYYYQPEVGYMGDFIYEKAEGTEIKWKSDEKDLTKVIEVKKQRNKNTQRTRLVKKTRPADSFFNFFSPPVPPSDEDEDDMSDNVLADLEMKLEVDYQIGEDFKEKIIPRAVDYFTGKALEYESMGEDEDDFEDYDEDSDEDDESDDEPPTARRRGKGRGGNNQNMDPAECKQQ